MRQSLTRLFRIAVVALLVACTAPATVTAQDDGGDSDDLADLLDLLDLGQYDGIESAVYRSWGVMSLTQEPEPGRLLSLATLIVRFGSDDEAADALQPVSDAISGGYTASGIPLIESDLDDEDQPGDEAIRSVVDLDAPGTGQLDEADLELFSGLTVLSVRADETIVVVLALPLEGDAEATTVAMAERVIEREAGDDRVSFDADGASTGGLFDRLPDADDPLLTEAGVEPFSDTILYPAPDEDEVRPGGGRQEVSVG